MIPQVENLFWCPDSMSFFKIVKNRCKNDQNGYIYNGGIYIFLFIFNKIFRSINISLMSLNAYLSNDAKGLVKNGFPPVYGIPVCIVSAASPLYTLNAIN